MTGSGRTVTTRGKLPRHGAPRVRRIILGDCARVLPTLPERLARLAYIDPPFNTGSTQRRIRLRATAVAEGGDRVGFGGRSYRTERLARGPRFDDRREDFE